MCLSLCSCASKDSSHLFRRLWVPFQHNFLISILWKTPKTLKRQNPRDLELHTLTGITDNAWSDFTEHDRAFVSKNAEITKPATGAHARNTAEANPVPKADKTKKKWKIDQR